MIISKAHKKILVSGPDVDMMFQQAQQIEAIGKRHRIINHGPRETLKLNALGIKAPNPMLAYYEWAGNHKPFEVQRATCDLLSTSPRAYVLNDMGTGKTRTPLWAWDYLNRAGC